MLWNLEVIKRNGNAVVPDGMFKLCGMENAKLISMVQLEWRHFAYARKREYI